MEIILFFCMLGASLLLGLCYGILYLPDKRYQQAGFKDYNRVEKALMKLHQPTLKIVISLLIVALFGLSWQQACVIDERWYSVCMLMLLFLLSAYILTLLMYVCLHPYYLEKKSFLSGGTWRENKRTHLVLAVVFALVSVGVIIYLLVAGKLLHFVLFPLVFIIILVGYAALWFCKVFIRILFLSGRSLVHFCAYIWQSYWDWVLKH